MLITEQFMQKHKSCITESVYSHIHPTGCGPRSTHVKIIYNIMDEGSSTDRRDYAKFNGVNFPQWKFGVKPYLRRKKLDLIVLGTEEKPTEVNSIYRIILDPNATL